ETSHRWNVSDRKASSFQKRREGDAVRTDEKPDFPVQIGAQHRDAAAFQPLQHLPAGMAVNVAFADGYDGKARLPPVQPKFRRGRPAAVVGDFHDVDGFPDAFRRGARSGAARPGPGGPQAEDRSEEHTSELQSREN